MVPLLAPTDYSFDKIHDMGLLNVSWLFLLLFLFIAWRGKKVGVTSIGRNEWGMLEILGFPLLPVPFGIWLFVKGIFHVKEVSTAPTRVVISLRQKVAGKVLLVEIVIHVTATTQYTGTRWQCFRQRRHDLIAALYGAYDDDVNDAENPERNLQTYDILKDACRKVLREANAMDALDKLSLVEACGNELRDRLGEYIMAVYLNEDAPVDGELWKEGRSSDGNFIDELPPGVTRLPSPDMA